LAIHEEGEKFESGKASLPTKLFELMRCGQHGERRCNLWVANPEQRGGARRFQDHLVGAPAQIREPRQDQSVGIAQRRRSRPIIGKLRFDDGLLLAIARSPEAILQQPVSGQAADQSINVLVGAAAAGHKRAQRQTCAELLRAIRGGCAELSQANRMPSEAGTDRSVRVHLQPDVRTEPGRQRCRCSSSASLCSRSAQAG
jgi:hypothetical protein